MIFLIFLCTFLFLGGLFWLVYLLKNIKLPSQTKIGELVLQNMRESYEDCDIDKKVLNYSNGQIHLQIWDKKVFVFYKDEEGVFISLADELNGLDKRLIFRKALEDYKKHREVLSSQKRAKIVSLLSKKV